MRLEVHRYLVFLLYALVAGVVLVMFLRHPGIGGFPFATVPDVIYGRAHVPYVHRALVPTMVRLTIALVPAEARVSLREAARQDSTISTIVRKLDWEVEFLLEYLVAALFAYFLLLAFAFSARYLFTGVYQSRPAFGNLVGLAALLGLPPHFQYQNYLYDPATLFLFTLGLALMVRGNWLAYVFVFALGCLNKETTILLTLVFATYFGTMGRMERGLFHKLTIAQLLIFLSIEAALWVTFRGNPGSLVQFHLFDHNLGQLYPYSLPTFCSWIGVMLLMTYRWAEKPSFLKHALLVSLPLFVLTALFGYLDEFRDYYEVYPIALLLSAHTIGAVVGMKVQSLRQ